MSRRRSAEQYRTARAGAAAPALVEARLSRQDGRPSTDAEYRSAFRELIDTGAVPAGWQATAIQWAHYEVRNKRARLVEWQAGEATDLAAFGAVVGSMADANMGVERVTRKREVTRARWVTVVTEELTGNERWRSVGTSSKERGQYVSPAYAARYPHLVFLDRGTVRKVKRRKRVIETEVIETEEAVIRCPYGDFS